MKVTINDVAKRAGVSIKTVSRVINNEASVRQATREKVQTAIDELDYQPNLAARSLAGTKSYTIAFIYDNPNAYYVIDMQNGILSECKRQGYELLIHPCHAKSVNICEELMTMVKHSRVAGLVLTPPFSEMPQIVRALSELDVNIIRIVSGKQSPDDLSPCVMVNDRDAAANVTQHLIDLGHKKIGFINGGMEHMSSHERLDGYKEAMQNNDLEIDPQLIIAGEYSFESGVQGANVLLGGDKRPSAIFACNDEIAAGALFAARLMNISVPEQLSIIGFEDSPFSRQTWPKLTTAHQPNEIIAQHAASLLISATRQQKTSDVTNHFVPELVIRDSTSRFVG
ncbi:MAG: LacI family transcriptional regulator [Alteromonadaceae bacterium]|jgi:LacI family transcriptional regulator